MVKLSLATLRQIINKPLSALGYKFTKIENESFSTAMPTWSERIYHAQKLGFSPGVIIDGGAFNGLWSKEVSQLFPEAQIIVIEPNPYLQETIVQNIAHITPAPKVLNVALGESPGKETLNIWRDKETDSGASLLNHVSGNALNAIEVNVDTIDDIAMKLSVSPDFVKLDLQGGELAALKGATQVLKRAELMIIEFSCLEAYKNRATPRDLMEIMYDNNYCLYDVVDCHYRPYDGALTGGDFFFLKNSSKLRKFKGWE